MGALRSSSASACGWPPGFGSSERRGAQGCALCCRHPVRSSASTTWPPSLAAETPVSAFRQCQHQGQPHSRIRSFVTALNGFTSPPPQPCCDLLRPARSRPLLARSRARHLRPVRPPPGASLFNLLSCGPRQPAPGRRFTVPQASCGTARAAINPGSLTQRLMAAAAAAAMMRGRQTGTSQCGGSVSGGKVRVGSLGLRWC